jgi:hypothetical protein
VSLRPPLKSPTATLGGLRLYHRRFEWGQNAERFLELLGCKLRGAPQFCEAKIELGDLKERINILNAI